MRLAGCAAVLAGDLPTGCRASEAVRIVPPASPRRALSSAALYALDAVRALPDLPADPALYTISGPSGSWVHLFDAARAQPGEGLVDADFPRRSRRIHPFTLLLALQNQVAAMLSLELGLRGPCCNAIDSAAAFADLLANMERELETRPVLVVLSSAANRGDERSRNRAQTGCDLGAEGAVALLFSRDGALGTIESAESGPIEVVGAGLATEAGERWPFAPCLEPGLAILLALSSGWSRRTFEIREPGRTSRFSWSAA